MVFYGIVLGYAGVEGNDRRPAESPNFQAVIAELKRVNDSNFVYVGCVNSGEKENQKKGITPSLRADIPFDYQLVTLNDNYRKRFPKVAQLSQHIPVRPTVVIMADRAREAMGMIAVPAGNWVGGRYEFMANLNFFLNPTEKQIKNGLVPPNRQILEIKFQPWREQMRYNLERAV